MFNKKLLVLLFVIVAVAALVAACGPGNAGSGGGGGGGTTPLSVTINANEFKYDPNTITAKVGQTVNVTLVNKGTVKHTFVIDALKVNISADPGQSATGSFTPTSAGTFQFYCDQPGHKDAGMTGTLTVQ